MLWPAPSLSDSGASSLDILAIITSPNIYIRSSIMSRRHSQAFMKFTHGMTVDEIFRQQYLALKIKLGMFEIEGDMAPDPETGHIMYTQAACESLSETLATFAGVALRYVGDGLLFLGDRVFESLRNGAEKNFLSYQQICVNYKNRVWKNARDLDGTKFDAYTVNVVPHKELSKRLTAVEKVCKVLNNVDSIYSAPVKKNSADWTTPECNAAIKAMEDIGFQARNYDFLATVSKTYANARKNQPLYLHQYTPKNIMDLIDRCERLSTYSDPKYIDKFEEKYGKCTDKLQDFELDTAEKDDEEVTAARDHESKVRAARLWWMAHFIRAVYTVMKDIFSDIEKLTLATERCIAVSE